MNVTVLLLGTNVPVLFQLPNTSNVFVPVIVRLAPALMVRSLATAPGPEINGIRGAAPGITTSLVFVGRIVQFQLLGLNQSVSTDPSQLPGARIVIALV